MVIRKIDSKDALQISVLANQLGYNINEAAVTTQIASVVKHSEHLVFIAIQDDKLTGFIHGCKMLRLTSPTFWEICGLVVDRNYRRQGIGKKLVQHLKNSIEPNINIRVRCNVKRDSAHLFYKDLGYAEKKEQKVFEKQADSGRL